MTSRRVFLATPSPPRCAGIGLVALDAIINGRPDMPPNLKAGGTCGNVLAILSYLGWKSSPIAHLGQGRMSELLCKDLGRFGVRRALIEQSTQGRTPVVVEQLRIDRSGNPRHSFRLSCPYCGFPLPRHRAVPLGRVQRILQKLESVEVFFFDKLSSSALKLAHEYRKRGALVVFEPSGVKKRHWFEQAVQVSHIVKYSHHRMRHAKEITVKATVPLQIETLGVKGLRYRFRPRGDEDGGWQHMPAFRVECLVDAAGCGDWCSAGLIHLLGRDGAQGMKHMRRQRIAEALRFGQALAAINCVFEGPRGSMYAMGRKRFASVAKTLFQRNVLASVGTRKAAAAGDHRLAPFCPRCSKRAHANTVTSKHVRAP